MTDDADNHQVTGAPDAIWLVYGDIERDSTHAECCASGEVTWCEDAQFAADVRYTRTDLVAERVRAAVAAEREQWRAAAEYAAHQLEQARIWNGMEWHYNPLHPMHYRSALDRLRAVIEKAEFHGGTFEIEGGGVKYTVTVKKESSQ